MEGRSWAGSFSQRGRAPLPAFLFHCLNPGSSGPRPLLGVWAGLSRGGYSDPERWGRESGRERGVWHARFSPPPAPRPPFCGCSAATRRRLRRRGGGVARFRLPPAVTLPGRACSQSPLGWPCGGRGRLRPHFSAFPNCGRWEGARRAGDSVRLRSSRGGSGRCGCCGLGPGNDRVGSRVLILSARDPA